MYSLLQPGFVAPDSSSISYDNSKCQMRSGITITGNRSAEATNNERTDKQVVNNQADRQTLTLKGSLWMDVCSSVFVVVFFTTHMIVFLLVYVSLPMTPVMLTQLIELITGATKKEHKL